MIVNASNEKRPRQGVSWATGLLERLAGQHELAALALLKPGILSLGADLPKDRAVERGVGRLAAGAGPVALRRHGFDQLLAVHGLAVLAQDLRSGIDGAELRLGLGLGLARLGRRGLRRGFRRGLGLGGLLFCR